MKIIKQKYNTMSKTSVVSWLLGVFIVLASIYLFIMIKSAIATISYALSPPELPAYKSVEKQANYEELQQNWSAEQAEWFHHVSQGTATLPIPYDWLMALEQPASSPWLMFFSEKGLYTSNDYILRLGFIKGTKTEFNPDALPIGFAKSESMNFTGLNYKTTSVGFTCAACHTSRLIYENTEYVIEGGPAMTDLSLLTSTLGSALGQTVLSSKLAIFNGRFDRFAERVLGEQLNVLTKAELKTQLDDIIKHLAKNKDTIEITEGFSRLDALNRIGNQVFSANLNHHKNYSAINAPVNYPHIWTTSWFNWVQYDGSIMQPLVRNAGEALGVEAYVNTTAPLDGQRFASSIPYNNLYKIEKLLAGDYPENKQLFNGLHAPSWPVNLPKINKNKSAKGKVLYEQRCQGCHLPPISSPEIWSDEYIKPIIYYSNGVEQKTEEKYLALNIIPLNEIGTDPMQAGVLTNRTIDTTNIGLDTSVCTNYPLKPSMGYANKSYQKRQLVTVPFKDSSTANFGLALGAFVQETNDQWMLQNYIPKNWWDTYNGGRPNCLQVGMGYKARPLNGIWATAPFLHNGSVPSIYALLSPLSERPVFVQLGSQEFDAKQVGVKQSQSFLQNIKKFKSKSIGSVPEYDNGFFILDTREKGNSNKGHQFEKGYVYKADNPKGVIGSYLTPEERENIVEYLKTL